MSGLTNGGPANNAALETSKACLAGRLNRDEIKPFFTGSARILNIKREIDRRLEVVSGVKLLDRDNVDLLLQVRDVIHDAVIKSYRRF